MIDHAISNNHNTYVSIISRLFSKDSISNPSSLMLEDGTQILVHFKKMPQSRNFRMRLARDGNSVIVTLPQRQSLKSALNFAQGARGWILAQKSKHRADIKIEIDGDIPIFGRKTILKIAPPRSPMSLVRADDIQILNIGSKPENFQEKTKSALKKLAHEAALTHLKILETKLEKPPTKLKITDTKSRWGSCTHDGIISLSFRLVMAPPDVFHYVIAHELAHLKEMNHSPKFWKEVERLMPNHATHKNWLKKNGIMLHRIGL